MSNIPSTLLQVITESITNNNCWAAYIYEIIMNNYSYNEQLKLFKLLDHHNFTIDISWGKLHALTTTHNRKIFRYLVDTIDADIILLYFRDMISTNESDTEYEVEEWDTKYNYNGNNDEEGSNIWKIVILCRYTHAMIKSNKLPYEYIQYIYDWLSKCSINVLKISKIRLLKKLVYKMLVEQPTYLPPPPLLPLTAYSICESLEKYKATALSCLNCDNIDVRTIAQSILNQISMVKC